MTDREITEAAAAAIGKHLGGWWWDGLGFSTHKGLHDDERIHWRPLADDGDALRLAVKLGFDMMLYSDVKGVFHGDTGQQFAEDARGSDPAAAVRRAIVRAAAALAVSDLAKMEGAK